MGGFQSIKDQYKMLHDIMPSTSSLYKEKLVTFLLSSCVYSKIRQKMAERD